MVSVVMITYGHEQFIKQAIEGVLMQQCDFEVELIIANDCSPDNTNRVVNQLIENHPNSNRIKYTKHHSNKGMMLNFIWALQQAKGQYIALCDGDDYWTDPLKLKKQVDFLEENSKYNIVWTKFNKIDSKGQIIASDLPKFQPFVAEVTAENLLENYRTWTLTAVFRGSVFDAVDFSQFKHLKDNTVYFLALRNSAVGRVLDLNTANYRVHEDGVWSMNSDFKNNLMNYYNISEIRNKIIENKAIEQNTNQTLRLLYYNMIDEKLSPTIPIIYYNQLFYSMLYKLPVKDKLRFLRSYLKKLF